MVDLSSLSDAELDALESQMSGGAASAPSIPQDLTQLSDSQLDALESAATSSRSQDWNIIDSLKNFGSGAVEEVFGLGALAQDLFSPGPSMRVGKDGKPYMGIGPDLNFTAGQRVKSELAPLLAEEDPQYRYARTIGQFASPSLAGSGIKAIVKGAAPKIVGLAKNGITDLVAALGAQGAEDVTGDTKIAPLLGAITGAGASSAVTDSLGFLKRALIGATDEEIAGSAGKALREATGLTAPQIESTIKNLNPLEQLQTTAERTGNAGFAQIEKSLAGTGQRAIDYSLLAEKRNKLRDFMLSAMGGPRAVNKEGLGSALINRADDVKAELEGIARDLWDNVPRHEVVGIGPEQKNLLQILKQRQAGLEPGSKVSTLVGQFMNPDNGGILSSGALQDIRSDALTLLRDANLMPEERRILNAIQGGADSAMMRGLEGADSEAWKMARDATSTIKANYGRGTAGGSLIADTARPSNVLANAFKGDAQSIKELKVAIGNDPALLDQVRTGILDMIPRDAQGRLTPNGMKKFLAANEGGVKELFGGGHYDDMQSILSDLRSEANVSENAFKASKGNSVTNQKGTVAGAIQDAVLRTVSPGGILGEVYDAFRKGAGIRDTEKINDLLFKAALDPKYAAELAAKPSAKRIRTAVETLKSGMLGMAIAGSVAGAKELGRTQTNITPGQSLAQISQIISEEDDARDLAAIASAAQERSQSGKVEGPAVHSEERGQFLGMPIPEGLRSSPIAPSELSGAPSASPTSPPMRQPRIGSTGTSQSRSQSAPAATAKESSTYIDSLPPREATQAIISRRAVSGRGPNAFIDNALSKAEAKIAGSITESDLPSSPLKPLYDAVQKQESGGNKNAVSKKGATGLMQIMPDTAKWIAKQLDLKKYDIKDPVTNRLMGEWYLAHLMDQFDGDTELALAGYNAGPAKVEQWIKQYGRDWKEISKNLKSRGYYKETTAYVPKVLSRMA